MKKKITISDALFSKVRQRVLGLLYGQPDSDFHTNEIIRLTDSGTGAVQRELESLTNSGLVVVKQVGNQKRYQANRDTPFFAPHTVGAGPELWRVLAKCHDLRNLAEYEGSLEVDDQILRDLLTATESLLKHVEKLSK